MPAEIGQVLLFVFLLLWFAHYIIVNRRLPHFPISLLQLPVLGFVVAVGLSAFTAVSLTAWLTEFIKWTEVVILISLVMFVSQRYGWRWIVYLLIAAASANAVIGIYQFFGGSGALHLVVVGRFFRAFGTFGQPNPFGGFMGLIAPLAIATTLNHFIALWVDWKHRGKPSLLKIATLLIVAAAAGMIVLALFMSWSRGAWLGFIAAFGVMTVAFPQRLWQSVMLLFVGLGLLTVAWYADLVPQAIAARLQSVVLDISALDDARGVEITTANYANIERLAHWQAAIRMAESDFWLGVGAGNYEFVYPVYQLINWDEPLGHAHNYYLNVIAETGFVGLLAYVTMWVVFYGVTWRLRYHPAQTVRHIAIGLLGTWTYLAVHSLTDNLYVNNLFIFIGLSLGILATLHRQRTHFNRVEL